MGNVLQPFTPDEALHGNDTRSEMKDYRTPIEIALGVDENGNTTAKKLYEFLELDPTHYSRWYKKNITENEFAEENIDFWALAINGERDFNPNPTQDFKLSSKFARKLSAKGNGEKAELARDYFASLDDGVKTMAQSFDELSPELRLLINMELKQKQQDREMLAMREDIKRLESKVTTHIDDYYTIAGYASLRGIKVDINKANMLGRKASKLSREFGYEIGKAKDPRFGEVNTYHIDILKEVFKR